MSDAAEEFDFIVSGAGSAGCAVAARLSESGKYTVLLLEAGPEDKAFWIGVPAGFPMLFTDRRVNWAFQTEPNPEFRDRQFYQARGKVLGGSSAINGMLYVRGHARDYDLWRQKGCTGWSYEDVLPFFKKAEDYEPGGDDYHGAGGPLAVTDQGDASALPRAFVEAAQQAGIPYNPDFNAERQEGVGFYQTTIRDRRRWSTAQAYLRPARNRSNLKIQTGAQATRVLVEEGRAVGIEFSTAAGIRTARARREVILCGGAFGSPQLLQLSGIGPAEHLRDFGVPVVRDLPGVGSNLVDHFCVSIMFRATGAPTMNDLANSWFRKISAGVQYVLFKRGPLTVNGIPAGLFTRTDPSLDRPNLQFVTTMWSAKAMSAKGVVPHEFPGFSMNLVDLSPDSSGSVRLKSSDPLADPEIRQHFLRTERDLDTMLKAIRLAREIARQPALAPYNAGEIGYSVDKHSDEELEALLRATGGPNLHVAGSCRMGTDETCVVDPRLRVHGVGGLRVADASIMPTVTAGNTNAPTIMIGEKAAAMILEDAK